MASNLKQQIEITFKSNYKEILKQTDKIDGVLKEFGSKADKGFKLRFINYTDIIKKVNRISRKFKSIENIRFKATGMNQIISKMNKIKSKSRVSIKFSSNGLNSIEKRVKKINQSGNKGGGQGMFSSSAKSMIGKVGGLGAAIGIFKAGNDFFKNIEQNQDKIQAIFFSQDSNSTGRKKANTFISSTIQEANTRGLNTDLLYETARQMKEAGIKGWRTPNKVGMIASNAQINNFDVNDLVDILKNTQKQGLGIDTTLGMIQNLKATSGDTRKDLIGALQEYTQVNSDNGVSFIKFLEISKQGKKSGAFNYDKIGDLVKESYIRVGQMMINNPKSLNKLGITFDKKQFLKGNKTLKQAYASGDVNKSDVLFLINKVIKQLPQGKKQAFLTEFNGTMSEDIGTKASMAVLSSLSTPMSGQQISKYKTQGLETIYKQQQIFKGQSDQSLSSVGNSFTKFKSTSGEIYNALTAFFGNGNLDIANKRNTRIKEIEKKDIEETKQMQKEQLIESKKQSFLLGNIANGQVSKSGNVDLNSYNDTKDLNTFKYK